MAVCNKYAESIEKKQTPHLILDTTKSGVASETVKSFTQALGLPTISASYGQEGDLRQWRDLDESKQKYLLQVMPPADIIPEAVRSIVKRLNITNGWVTFSLITNWVLYILLPLLLFPSCHTVRRYLRHGSQI